MFSYSYSLGNLLTLESRAGVFGDVAQHSCSSAKCQAAQKFTSKSKVPETGLWSLMVYIMWLM